MGHAARIFEILHTSAITAIDKHLLYIYMELICMRCAIHSNQHHYFTILFRFDLDDDNPSNEAKHSQARAHTNTHKPSIPIRPYQFNRRLFVS